MLCNKFVFLPTIALCRIHITHYNHNTPHDQLIMLNMVDYLYTEVLLEKDCCSSCVGGSGAVTYLLQLKVNLQISTLTVIYPFLYATFKHRFGMIMR